MSFTGARVEDAQLGSVEPTERRADLVVVLEGEAPLAVAQAAFAAATRLDEGRAALYFDLTFTWVGRAAREALEAMMANSEYEFRSDFMRNLVAKARDEARAEGRAEGKAEGRAEGEALGVARGKAQAVLATLTARRLPLTDAERARILSCTDLAKLDAWITRAVSAESVAALFET